MKSFLFPIVVLGFVCSASVVCAAPGDLTPQQNKMAACNHDAGTRKGADRNAFMKECLSAKRAVTQQEKMKICNHDARDRKGEERKAFMKECLKK
jgi:hypothetical protein